MKRPKSARRPPAHTHWVAASFRSLSSADILLIQAHFTVGDRAPDIAKKFSCCAGTVYKAKKSVLVKHIHVDGKALDRSVRDVVLALKKKSPAVRLRALPKTSRRKAS